MLESTTLDVCVATQDWIYIVIGRAAQPLNWESTQKAI